MSIARYIMATAFSDSGRFVKGKKVVATTADETVAVIAIPRKAFVERVYVEIITPYDSDATTHEFDVGFEGNGESADPNFFGAKATVVPTAAGMKVLDVPKYFENAGGVITVSTVDGDSDTNPNVAYRVFVDYEIIH